MELDLRRTRITDAELVHLKELTNLKFLPHDDTQVTDAGAAELRKALAQVWSQQLISVRAKRTCLVQRSTLNAQRTSLYRCSAP